MTEMTLGKYLAMDPDLKLTKIASTKKSKWCKVISAENVQYLTRLKALYIETKNRGHKARRYRVRIIVDGNIIINQSYKIPASKTAFVQIAGAQLYFDRAGRPVGCGPGVPGIFFSHGLSVDVRTSHADLKMRVYSHLSCSPWHWEDKERKHD